MFHAWLLRGAARGIFAGGATTYAGLKAAADTSSSTALWVALIGAVATVLAVTLPILLRRNRVDDEQLALALVDKLAAAEKEAHRKHQAQQQQIAHLKAQLAAEKRRTGGE